MSVTVSRVSLAGALAACDRWHSHLPPPVGGLYALAAWSDGRCVAVCVVGRPSARRLDDGSVHEVTRLASDGSTRGACSALLRAAVRESASRGAPRVVSYTLLGEVGACYRAARWRPVALTDGGSWARVGRDRAEPVQGGRKVRWEAGASALPRSLEAMAAIAEHAGRDLPRRERLQRELEVSS